MVNEDGSNATFVIVDWPAANVWRVKKGLPKTDFHITLGFSREDVHGVAKDELTLVVK